MTPKDVDRIKDAAGKKGDGSLDDFADRAKTAADNNVKDGRVPESTDDTKK